MPEEMFDIVDDVTGEVISQARRSECHSNPSLIHRSVRVVFFDSSGRMLLQKRAVTKDIQPGKWDTAVGGHLDCGEDYETAAAREIREELGVDPEKLKLVFLFDYRERNERESENVRTFSTVYDGPFTIQRSELDAVAFYEPAYLRKILEEGNTDEFTPLLCKELKKILY